MAGESILVVDDNRTNLKVARLLLERAGYDARTATNAEEALRALSTRKPRLILMDVRLPGIDGLELTRRLRADVASNDIVILALSASGTTTDERRALAAGCDAYVAKPYDVDALLGVIAEHLLLPRVTP